MTALLFPEAECFRTVLSDVPWSLNNFGQAKHGAARSAFPCMSDEDLCKIPVGRWAADDGLMP